MEEIGDFSWFKQLLTGEVLERMSLGEYRTVALRIPITEGNPSTQYRYRLLLFHGEDAKPSVAFNLETSILGSLCFTEQIGREHRNLGPAADSITYEEFRRWALERADYLLAHGAEPLPERGRRPAARGRNQRRPRQARPKRIQK